MLGVPRMARVLRFVSAVLVALGLLMLTAVDVADAQEGVAEVDFSVPHGFYSSNQSVSLSTPTAGATIRYTTNGRAPSASNGSLYTGPIVVDGTTVLRAIAVKSGLASPVTTASYFFVDDVITQSQSAPPGFPSAPVNGQLYDYGMDPDVVNGNQAAVRAALLAIPTISISTDTAHLFSAETGIYSNPEGSGREWERPASLELIDPTGQEAGFEIEAGLRIRGGFSRSVRNPKHSFRVFFRNDYGGDLDYPLFGAEGAGSFEKIDFRTAQNYSYSFRNSDQNTFLREVFSRDLQAELGQPYTRSRYYHLYLNGQYWGLYMSQERVSKEYAETYFGGDKDDYDVIKHDRQNDKRFDATDGDDVAWRALWPLISDQDVSASEYAQLDSLVDLDSLIDSQLIYIYTGDHDGSPSNFSAANVRGNNWYAVRNRTGQGPAGKWQFFVHDAEHTLAARFGDVDLDRTGPFPVDSPYYTVEFLHPYWIHRALTSNADYLARFEARANQLLRGNGAMTSAEGQARWDAREATVAQVILAESARWGDSLKTTPPKTTADWAAEVAFVENNWFPVRTANVLNHLGLPPTLANDPPQVVSPGPQLSLAAADVSVAVIGSDPEGQALTWSADGLPAGLSIDQQSGVISGYSLEAGIFTIIVTATDTLGLADDASFVWTVNFPESSPVVLNEWNAVGKDDLLKNGGSDTFFGTVVGNGGDWFELVTTEDHLDLRGWSLELVDSDNDLLTPETTDVFTFNDSSLLADVRAGSIITVSEDLADDNSYDPAAGDWWINFQANSDDDGGFFTSGSQSNFDTNNDDWRLIIRDASGAPVFGPAGEGVGASGVSSTEIGELEDDPTAATTPLSPYDDGDDSTFGSPNGFDGRLQDLDAIRTVLSDTTEPDSLVIAPEPDETFEDTSFVISGTASDNVGVAAVQVAIRDRAAGQWLRDGTSSATAHFVDTVLDAPGASSTGWTLALTLPEGDYAVWVRAQDTAGNGETTRPWVNFSVEAALGDLEAPETVAFAPSRYQTVVGQTVVLTGEATDDIGVRRVFVSVRDRAAQLYLQPDGTFGQPFARFDAVLSNPDAAATDWTFSVDLEPGSYAMVVRAVDTSFNRDPTRVWSPFFVVSADVVEPESTLDTLARSGGTVTLTGTATDNVGVARVGIALRNLDTGDWLRSDGTLGAFELVSATLDAEDDPTTGWTFSAPLPAGDYRVRIRAIDLAGNNESTRPSQLFTIN